jgi:glycosyltransferase involved in cell wall biosynthesis
MSRLQRVAFIGNYLPRRCGIATFTQDLHEAVSAARPDVKTCVVAMTDSGQTYDYPSAVRFDVREDAIDDFSRAAEFLNAERCDVVCLQHEYGIFGGEAGANILELLAGLDVPIVTTLHTVLDKPTSAQRAVMARIGRLSAKLVVMSEKGRSLLHSVHDIDPQQIEVIPHGIPDVPFLETRFGKYKFGFAGKKVILTFGLLSPNKGVETMLDAMPEIIRRCPNAIYVILGATHPNLVRYEGEVYRDGLEARARELGVEDHVVFFNQFVDQATLLNYISACDVYVTPYHHEEQLTSGTLAYSFGMGKAVVSTPYWHAEELLGDGLGVLVPFESSEALSHEIAGLLTNDVRRQSMRKRAYAASRSMTWEQTAQRYLTVFNAVRESSRSWSAARRDRSRANGDGAGSDHDGSLRGARVLPDVRIGHFLSLCDSTGIAQHAVYSVPDRAHGYCVDDNARALLLSLALSGGGEEPLPEAMTARFASFVQHAWNPDTLRFRNFMSYDRRWLEPVGSEDSHGRTLWALGECARGADQSRSRWAAALFEKALPTVEQFTSPRAWAFTLLGLDAYCAHVTQAPLAERMRRLLADRLMSQWSASRTTDWRWFEDWLAYDNPRFCQALIQTGMTTRKPQYVEAGLDSLRWLMALQTAPSGCFRPVGSEGFGTYRQPPAMFDQQPIEALAAISACLAAWRAEQRPDARAEWRASAMRAFGWFVGQNDLHTSLIDHSTGGCLDGLHSDRANQNMGAESVLSYLLGLIEMRQFERATAKGQTAGRSPLSWGEGRKNNNLVP